MATYRYSTICPMIFGEGAVQSTGKQAASSKCTRVLLVSDDVMIHQPGYAVCKKSLQDVGIEVVEYSKCLSDAPDYIVMECSELGRQEQVNGLVAFGGGSVIDTAKAANLMMNNSPPISQYYMKWKYNKLFPLIAIPTTAGTGSETTIFSVVSDSGLHTKNSLFVIAGSGILDPELTYTVPSDITAFTGMDAFAHSAEAMTSRARNPYSDVMGSDAIRRIVKHLPVAVKDGSNREARHEMMLASNFSGVSFNVAFTHMGHSMAHALGATYHIPHGVGCALAAPVVQECCAQIVPDAVRNVGIAMGLSFSGSETDAQVGEKVAAAIRSFMKEIGIPSLKDLGISRDDAIAVSEMAVNDPGMPSFPRKDPPVTVDEMKQLMADLYDKYQ